jgi:hypothetical protein
MDAQDTTVMIVHQKYWSMRRVELISKCLRSVLIARSITVLIAREWNVVRLVLDVTSMSALTVTLCKNARGAIGRCVATVSPNEEVAADATRHQHFVISASKHSTFSL